MKDKYVYESQLWQLMNDFGPTLALGGQPPFIDCAIYFSDDNLKDAEMQMRANEFLRVIKKITLFLFTFETKRSII